VNAVTDMLRRTTSIGFWGGICALFGLFVGMATWLSARRFYVLLLFWR
jgi:hypothetical protein